MKHSTSLPCVLGVLAAIAVACWLPSVARAASPNVLIIMADDCTYNDLPIYGGQNAITPNLDALAAQSLTFNNAYLCSAMCQPCRAELYSGQYPMRNGCAWNHSASRAETTSLPHYLGESGYRVGLAGKVHVSPATAFPFENVPGFDKNCVRSPTQEHSLAEVGEFMSRSSTEPFCLVVALVEPHVPWVMGDASQYPVADLKLPPNLADTQRTRQDYASYLAEITYMDSQVGELLEMLDTAGKRESTLVLFTSEQGAQFPGCKWTNWNTGIHTALVARWPGHTSPGTRTDALVQYADIAPTLVAAAGGDVADLPVDGKSFLGVLEGASAEHRQYAYGMHNNYPEGPPYPIRSVTDGQFHYIRNLSPDDMYIEKHVMGRIKDGSLNNPYWATWIWDSTTNKETYNLVKRYQHRPAEELYRLASDPYEMQNLAELPEFAEVKQRLSRELDGWMSAQGDPGREQDTLRSHTASKRQAHRFIPPTATPAQP